MTFKRLLTVAAVLAFLVLAVPAFADDSGGGAVIPAAEPSVEPAVPAQTVEPAQETPTTPEGEEQPPEEEPDGEQPPTEVDPEPGPEEQAGESPAETTGGELPRTGTGVELAALTAIGLGLLLAGAALWPTSSWPPPRGRPSRSTTRR